MRPNMTVVTRVNHTAMSRFFFMKALSDKSQIRQQHIDQLDSDKWSNDSPDAIEQQVARSEEHTSELQSRLHLVCRLLLEKKKKTTINSLIDSVILELTMYFIQIKLQFPTSALELTYIAVCRFLFVILNV